MFEKSIWLLSFVGSHSPPLPPSPAYFPSSNSPPPIVSLIIFLFLYSSFSPSLVSSHLRLTEIKKKYAKAAHLPDPEKMKKKIYGKDNLFILLVIAVNSLPLAGRGVGSCISCDTIVKARLSMCGVVLLVLYLCVCVCVDWSVL